MRTAIPALAIALASVLAVPVVAHAADQSGTEGQPLRVEINAPSADAYLQYHGRLFVVSGTTTTEYRWGGTSCGSRTMTPEMVQLLLDSVRQSGAVLTPTFQAGQGTSKCLVGFSIAVKESTTTTKPKGGPQ
jgi:hypothetical protein